MILMRLSILAACLIVLTIWANWIRGNTERWRFSVLPLTYVLHTILFTLAAQFRLFSPENLNIWSNGVRLHSLIVIGAIGTLLLYIGRNWTWKLRK